MATVSRAPTVTTDDAVARGVRARPTETVKVTEASPTLEKVANRDRAAASCIRGSAITDTVNGARTPATRRTTGGSITDILLCRSWQSPGLSVTASGGSFTAGSDITRSVSGHDHLAGGPRHPARRRTWSTRSWSARRSAAGDAAQQRRVVQFGETRPRTGAHRQAEHRQGGSPVAGGGTVVEFGDTLTYTLTVSTTGQLIQPNVKVDGLRARATTRRVRSRARRRT